MNILQTAVDLPRLIFLQFARPLRVAFRSTLEHPATQAQMAELVKTSLRHEIRAGYTHRFITLMFVTVGERVFCRRYSYGEPSWHSVFRNNPEGQIKADKTIVNIEAHVPHDLDEIISLVDQAYADKLRLLGARFMLPGAIEPRAQQSTLELTLSDRIPIKV